MIVQESDLIPYETSKIPSGKWLVFAPHADDETFGMGGTLLLAKQQGIQVSLVVMTDGILGSNNSNDTNIVNIRKQEVEQVALKLNLTSWHCLDEKDRGLAVTDKLLDKIGLILQKESPDHIFIPSVMELHPDHRLTAEIVFQAVKKICYNANIYCYEISVQSQINCLIDISTVIEEKKSLISIYQSQLSQNNYQDIAISLNKARTYTLANNISYAEGFLKLTLNSDSSLAKQGYDILANYWQYDKNLELPDNMTTIDIEEKNIEVSKLEHQVADLIKTINEYQYSTSWKVTKPIRYLKKLINSFIK